LPHSGSFRFGFGDFDWEGKYRPWYIGASQLPQERQLTKCSGIIQTLAIIIWLASRITIPSTRESGFSITSATINTKSISNQNGHNIHNIHHTLKTRSGFYTRCRGGYMDTTRPCAGAKGKRAFPDARCKWQPGIWRHADHEK
jgi:hypothetical protein